MKKIILTLIICLISIFSTEAQFNYGESYIKSSYTSSSKASITFRNKSEYTMTLRIIYAGGGYYSTVTLRPH